MVPLGYDESMNIHGKFTLTAFQTVAILLPPVILVAAIVHNSLDIGSVVECPM
jgi:hypothetical protein